MNLTCLCAVSKEIHHARQHLVQLPPAGMSSRHRGSMACRGELGSLATGVAERGLLCALYPAAKLLGRLRDHVGALANRSATESKPTQTNLPLGHGMRGLRGLLGVRVAIQGVRCQYCVNRQMQHGRRAAAATNRGRLLGRILLLCMPQPDDR